MTNPEFMQIMAAIESNFETKAKTAMALELWYEELKDLEYPICQKAVRGMYRNHDSRFVAVADIRKAYTEIVNPQVSFTEAYQLVNDCIRLFGRNRHSEAMDYLEQKNPAMHTVVKAYGFQNLCNTGPSFSRGPIERMYKEASKRGNEQLLLGNFKDDIEQVRLKSLPNHRRD